MSKTDQQLMDDRNAYWEFDDMPDLKFVTQGKLRLNTTTQKIGRIMSELGFEAGQKTISGKNCRVYFAKRKVYGVGEEESCPF